MSSQNNMWIDGLCHETFVKNAFFILVIRPGVPRQFSIKEKVDYEYSRKKRSFTCKLCDFLCKSVRKMEGHHNLDHRVGVQPYRCDKCDERFHSLDGLYRHNSRGHSKKAEEARMTTPKSPMKSWAKSKGVCGCGCGKTYTNQKSFYSHQKSVRFFLSD